MNQARSKIDILYQDVLGDIHDVLTKVDGLKVELPALADDVTAKLSDVLKEISHASSSARAATQSAERLCDRLAIDRQQLVVEVQAGIKKSVRASMQAGTGEGTVSQFCMPYIPAWYAVVTLFCGAGISLSVAAWIGARTDEQAQEAAIGRSFTRSIPNLDPKLKDKLIEHMRKHPG